MTAKFRITVREEVGSRVFLHTSEAETFDECVTKLREIRDKAIRAQTDAGSATMYRGLGGLTEPQ